MGIEKLSAVYRRDPRLLAVTVLLILVSGLSSLMVLPRAEDPRIVNRAANTVTRLAGADAERVEALVTEPLEDAILELDDVLGVDSTSRAGVSVLSIELRDEIGFEDVDQAWSRVRDRIDETIPQLPPEASKPDLNTDDFYAMTMLVAIRWDSDAPLSRAVLNRLAQDLEDRLRSVDGTEYTELNGVAREEIVVALEPDALAAMGLSAADVARAIDRADAKVAAGRATTSDRELLLEVEGELTSLDRVRETPVTSADGARTVRLADVATVTKATEDPPSRIAISEGKDSVVIGIRSEPGVRIGQWAEQARAAVEEFRAELGSGVEVEIIFDQSGYVTSRLSSLSQNFALGVAAVTFVIFLLMGWRSALLVGATLPLTALMVLAVMRFAGIPIHQMSVTGLVIALGLLIDNAIVVVDEMDKRRIKGETAGDAISHAISHLAVPLLGSTLTTVLAFLPIVLMPGGAGEFVGAISLGVIIALISSYILAMTVIPAVNAAIGSCGESRSWCTRGISFPSLLPAYRAFLRGAFRRPIATLALAMMLPFSGFALAGGLVEQFFPGAERNQFPLQLRLAEGASIERTREAVRRAEEALKEDPNVEAVHWFLGDSPPMFYYNLTGGEDDSPNFAGALVQMRDKKKGTETIRRVHRTLAEEIPEAQVFAMQLEQGPPFLAPIEMKIFGPDPEVLDELANDARALLADVPGVMASRTSMIVGRPQLTAQIDEQASREVGLDNLSVAAQLDAALDGAVGGSLLEGVEDIPVRVRVSSETRADPRAVDLFAPGAEGPADAIPLPAIADLTLEPTIASLDREDGSRVNRVLGYVHAGVLPGVALGEYQQRLEGALDLPPGYSIAWGGESGERNRAVSNLMASVTVLAVLMAAALVLSLRSFRGAGIIGFVAIGAAGFGMLALAVFDMPFGFMGIVGILGLIGVAINDSIVVLAALRESPREAMTDPDTMAGVVVGASRHVVATTLTTIAGFMPLLIGGGAFWPPLAVVIAGGVGGATVLALIVVPSASRIMYGRHGRAPSSDETTVHTPLPV